MRWRNPSQRTAALCCVWLKRTFIVILFNFVFIHGMAWRLPSPARASGNFTVWQPRAFISQRTRALRPPLWRNFSRNYLLIRSARSNSNIILQDVTITFNDNISGQCESDSIKNKVMLCYNYLLISASSPTSNQCFNWIFKIFYFKTISFRFQLAMRVYTLA